MKIKVVRDKMDTPRDTRDILHRPQSALYAKIALIGKLYEEVGEVANHQTDISEYADVYDVLVELARRNGFDISDIKEASRNKRKKRGGFRLCRILETTNHDNDK